MKKISALAISICFAVMLLGSSCSKDYDEPIAPEEITHEDHDHSSHAETRTSSNEYCTSCGASMSPYDTTCNLCGGQGIGNTTFCGKCGLVVSVVTNRCTNGCDDPDFSMYHCSRCGSTDAVPGSYKYCSHCGLRNNDSGWQECTGPMCSVCNPEAEPIPTPSESITIMIGALDPEFISELLFQWFEEQGTDVCMQLLGPHGTLVVAEAIQSGNLQQILNSFPYSKKTYIVTILLQWLREHGY